MRIKNNRDQRLRINMCYADFLNKPELQLPLTRNQDDFIDFVYKLFKIYRQGIAIYPSIRTAGEHLCDKIIEILKFYFEGLPNKSYDILSSTLTGEVQEWLKGSYDFKTSEMDNVRLYRMRIDKENVSEKKDIFHIPYEKRHLITTQRYSIPGLPCLYLGGSLYTCWLEMGKPRFEDISVAAFHLSEGQNIKFFKFYCNPRWILEYSRNDEVKETYIKLWPLYAVCFIKDYIPNANFKPEHIIPQLLLQWITQNSDYDGIQFFSTHINKITENPHWCCNYVFPATEYKTSGFCAKLQRKFILTEPYHWQILSSTNMNMNGRHDDDFQIEIITGHPEDYNYTKFGEVQCYLNYLLSIVRDRHRENLSYGKI